MPKVTKSRTSANNGVDVDSILINNLFLENRHLKRGNFNYSAPALDFNSNSNSNLKMENNDNVPVEEESENSVSIVGLSNVFQKDLPIARRLLWISSLFVCCSLVAYYVTNRLFYIRSLPTQVAVILKQNDTLVLPDVTICPSPMFIGSKMEKLGMSSDGVINSNFTQGSTFNASRLWEMISPTLDFIAVSVANTENSRGNWKPRFTTLGICFTHHYDGQIQASGLKFGMQIKFRWAELNSGADTDFKFQNAPRGFKIFFHPQNDEPLTEIEGIFVSAGQDVSIAIRLKEFQSLNRTDHPCIYDDNDKPRQSGKIQTGDKTGKGKSTLVQTQKQSGLGEYSKTRCVNKCFNSALYDLIQCSLPFMVERNSLEISPKQNAQNLIYCNTRQRYNEAFKKFWLGERLNVSTWARCGQQCLIECKKFIYIPYIESVAPSKRIQSTDGNNNAPISSLIIYFPEMTYEIVKEKEAYDLIALFCDVGGTFGLFLGCSILTLVELLETIVILLKRKLCPRSVSPK